MNASIGDVFKKRPGNIFLIVLISIITFLFCIPATTSAKVKGYCSNCHTMHNSQDTSYMVRDTGVWSGDDGLLGGSPDSTPSAQLLVTSCVGCHSASVDDTIISVGGSDIPIVYNTNKYPTKPLAGGNFYWVAQGNTSCAAANGGNCDEYGHNVSGISVADSKLNYAPGSIDLCGVGECHQTLATSDNSKHKPGCQACHQYQFHHVESDETSTNTGYRFLWGHTIDLGFNPVAWVEGKEDPDWEHPDSSGHNYYKGTTDTYVSGGAGLKNKHTISAFCSGCHVEFHGPYQVLNGNDGMGSSSPWLRHPTDIALPDTDEYSGYDPVGSYSMEAPVAWVDPTDPDRAEAVVMCLSCHRPHGSEQPDMLRWNYDNMMAGGGANSTGCFTCHTTKDDGS